MKKLFLTLALVAAGFCGTQAHAEWITKENIGEKLLWYIPNRFADAFDTFSVALGVGPVVEARLMATRAIDFGLGVGMTAKAYKTHNRQYGLGIEEGWYWSFIVGAEDYVISDTTPLVQEFSTAYPVDDLWVGFPLPNERVYDFFDGPRDYWAIGGSLGLFVDGDLYVHPLELVDFVLGFFLIDIKDDDFTMDDFR